ncbi:MAG: hypothetical protein HN712_23345 [Gemmatimonadetes bacterium]|jgi:Spy/CpxP family protein refolding chaperone|nr:hypothetical protein [Gemmatimonadota bacterium]MBT6148607.1 hypothetical protein [Gemmatimonadota bacterium]MBT7863271.1 hypothetical protein [Gemmatimonadota bacterium]
MRSVVQLSIVGAAALCLMLADAADAGGRGGQGRGGQGRGARNGSGLTVDREQRQARRDQQQARLTEALELTQEQQGQWEQLREEGQAEMKALHAGGEVSREDAEALRATHREAFRAILTDTQRETLEQLHQERAERGAGDRGRGRGRGPRQGARLDGHGQADPEKMEARRAERREAVAQALGLTEEQQGQMDQIRQDHRAAMDALRASGDVDREDVQALRTQQRTDLDAILTPEQLATLAQLHEQRPARGRRGPRGHGPDGDMAGDAVEEAVEGAGKAATISTTWSDVKKQDR